MIPEIPGHRVFAGLVLILGCLMLNGFPQSLTEGIITEAEKEMGDGMEDAEQEADQPELPGSLEYLLDLHDEPLDLNRVSYDELCTLLGLTDFQAFSLVGYRETFGRLVTLYELQAVDGFDKRTIQRIVPFVCVGNSIKEYPVKLRHVFRYGKQRMMVRVQRVLETREGFTKPDENHGAENTDSRYLGGPEHLFVNYRFKYREAVRFGLTLEKDPGETFFPSRLGDTILPGTQKRPVRAPDFNSFFLSLSSRGFLRNILIGDFQFQAGQAITLGRANAFRTAGDLTAIRNSQEGCRPHTGSDENRFFRGLALSLAWHRLHASFFYSAKRTDADIRTDTISGSAVAAARPDFSGYHRTPDEVTGQKSLKMNVLGGRIRFAGKRLGLGVTGYHATLDHRLENGDGLIMATASAIPGYYTGGLDYHYLAGRFSFFGELSAGRNGAMAQLHGISVTMHPGFTFSLSYRDYDRKYINLFGNVGLGGKPANETGFYTGFRMQLPGSVLLTGSLDVHKFPGPRFRADRPSRGKVIFVQAESNPLKPLSWLVRMRIRDRQLNTAGYDGFTTPLEALRKSQYSMVIGYPVSGSLTMRDRVEYVINRGVSGPARTGFLVMHDVRWAHRREKLLIDFRYVLFDTDTYDERIYAYEPDVLYAFSVPAHYYKGMKGMLLVRIRISESFTVWFKAARTWYLNRSVIGSGMQEINGSTLSTLKLQVMYAIR